VRIGLAAAAARILAAVAPAIVRSAVGIKNRVAHGNGAMQPERHTVSGIAAPLFTLEVCRASQSMTVPDDSVTLYGLELCLHSDAT